LHANAAELKIDPNGIAVMGDSGGGGLAAALALLARDRKEIPLCAQILLYPSLDMRTGTEEAPFDDPLTGDFVVNRPLTAFSWNAVNGSLSRDSDQVGYLSPALAKDLHGLPPAIVATGATRVPCTASTCWLARYQSRHERTSSPASYRF
jgi:acetyl esterase/lipase